MGAKVDSASSAILHLCSMTIVRDIQLGLSCFFRAFGFAMSHGMGWMFLVPVLLWLALALGFVALLQGPVDQLSDWLAARFEIPLDARVSDWWTDTKAFLNSARELIVGIVLKLAMGYLLFVANKYMVLILLSPLLAYASERTEEVITGRAFPFSWGQLLKDALRGALIAARNGVMELSISIGVWFITLFVPLLAPISFVLLFIVSAYFYGFSMFDYVFERRRMRIGESVRAVNHRIGAVMANGAVFSLVMKLPLVGVMFAPVMAAIGAVLASLKKEEALPFLDTAHSHHPSHP